MHRDTQLVHPPRCEVDGARASVVPLYQTATFTQPRADALGDWDYSRSGNPTRAVLEEQVARLEGGTRAFAFASGMAALTAVTRLVGVGERIVAGADLYGGTWRLLHELLPAGIEVELVDTTDLDAVDQALARPARLVLVESPTNPLLRITDLRALAERCRARGAWLAVDSSLMSPHLQRPLALGADLVIHSGTKFLGGHADLTAGLVVVHDEDLGRRLYRVQNGEGAALAPFDSWLLLRGLKTLAVRVERQQRSAAVVAAALTAHPVVARVWWPGLSDHPAATLHGAQAEGPGAVLSFETGSLAVSREVVQRAALFATSVSFGSVHASISLPCAFSHASIPDGARAVPADLVRVSVGLEDPGDLVADLGAALDASVRGGRCRMPSSSTSTPTPRPPSAPRGAPSPRPGSTTPSSSTGSVPT